MAKEYSRTQRVGDHMHQELARLLQQEVRDPRVEMINITGVEVSRDLAHAKVFYTKLGLENAKDAEEITAVLSKMAGFLRTELSRGSNMRQVPKLSFRFDESVGHGRSMEALFKQVQEADAKLHTDEEE